MESTYRNNMLHERQDPSGINCNPAVIVFGVFLICLIVMAPMVWTLVWTRNDNPDYVCRRARLKDILPTTTTREERPAQDGQQRSSIASRARVTASRVRGNAAAAGTVMVSYSRDAFLRVQSCLGRFSPESLRRRHHPTADSTSGPTYDLPIMRRPAWQKLAESYTDDTIEKPESVVAKDIGADNGAGVRTRSDALVSSGDGGGGGVQVDVQRPKVALVVGSTA